METFYKGYTKIIQDKPHYFVKKYLSFPEYKGVSDVLEGYGMHHDFNKACAIAGITDASVRKQLLDEIEGALPQAKIIELNNIDMMSVKEVGL
jgi:hypothetical protein